MNLAWWLERAALEWPDRVAVVSPEGTRTTYRDLRVLADQLGSFLRDRCDVQPREIVVTLLPDDHHHMALFYGTMKIGAAFTGLSRIQAAQRLTETVAATKARTIVTSAAHLGTAEHLLAQTQLEHIVVLDADPVGGAGYIDVLREVAGTDATLRIVPRASSDLAAVNFTAGTTGAGKGVVFTHGALGTSAQATVFWHGIRFGEVNIACISMYHSGGIHDAIKWVMAGGTLIWAGGWDREHVAELIRSEEPNWIYFLVPTMVRDLASHAEFASLPLEGVKTNLAGEPVPPELQQLLLDRGMRPVNAYGMTESMPVGIFVPPLYYDGDVEVPAGSSGPENVEFCEVRLVDPVTGAAIDTPDEAGEIRVRGDVITPAYLNSEDNERSFDAEGWLKTGDVASFDEEGNYWVGGRTDDIINTGGEKLSLAEVEDALRGAEIVQDVACIGAEHQRFGQCVAAVISTTTPMSCGRVRDELDAYCQEHLERWKRPRLYWVVDEVPRTFPKRSKDIGALRGLVAGIVVPDQSRPATMQELEQA